MKIMKSIPYRLSLLLVALILTFTVFGGSISYASAFSLSEALDNSNVLDDLQSSTVDGKLFSILAYPYNEFGSIKIINFVEYCYSYLASGRSNYGLYVYVYNPQNLNIVSESGQNKIQLGVPNNENEENITYHKYTLKFCNKSQGNYKNLFYKFKVVDQKIDGKKIVDMVSSNERRYYVSGIELLTNGNQNATEYGVGGKFKFTGYAEGLGPDAKSKSTLNGTVEELETLQLQVHHVNFRTNVSSLGKSHYNEVNSVYFALPQRVFDEYGTLQKIHAEWWEYKTKMAAITSNKEYYNQLLQYVGTYVGEHDGNVPVWLYSDYTGSAGTTIGAPSDHHYGWSYNKWLGTQTNNLGVVQAWYSSSKVSEILPYAFYAPATDLDNVFSFLYSKPTAGSVEGNVVQDWIYSYTNDLGNGYIDCNGRKISKDLFEDTVDEGRTMGYNNVNVDLQDTFNLKSYDSNHSWWDKLMDYGFSWPKTNGDYTEIAPIYVLEEDDLNGNSETVAERLLVDKDKVDELKTFYSTETKKGNKVVLFRFAQTDYYSAPAMRSGYSGSLDNTDTYVAQQTVFLDFDIIDLTFHKAGVYKVIPIVSSPTDIINGFDPPARELNWGRLLLAILLLVLLVVLLIPFFPTIFNAIIWFVTLPFKLVANIMKADKKSKKASRKQGVDEERCKKVMRSDYPKDFADEDPFTAALLDDLDKKEK